MVITVLLAGCGSDRRLRRAATYGPNTQLVPNNAPDGGATSINDALARFRAALVTRDVAEICRLSAYAPKGDCVSQWTPIYEQVRVTSTRIISTEHSGRNTIVVLESTGQHGRKHVKGSSKLGFGYRHGRWFVGVPD